MEISTEWRAVFTLSVDEENYILTHVLLMHCLKVDTSLFSFLSLFYCIDKSLVPSLPPLSPSMNDTFTNIKQLFELIFLLFAMCFTPYLNYKVVAWIMAAGEFYKQ